MRKASTFARLIVLMVVAILGIPIAVAQTNTQAKPAKKHASTQSTGKQAAMPKTPRMTSAQRWAAAARHGDRRAAHLRKHRGEVK